MRLELIGFTLDNIFDQNVSLIIRMSSFLNGNALVLIARPLACKLADDYAFLFFLEGDFRELVAV